MAELTSKERLQPSLLDRLTDDEPDTRHEASEKRVLTTRKLRQSVLRDITWLLNSRSLDSVYNLEDYPEVARSVLNYGIRDISGKTISGDSAGSVERDVRQALVDFEPRIMPKSLKVQLTASDATMSLSAMSFDIEGDLWAQPLPLHLYIQTVFDLETGDAKLRDLGG